MSGGKQYPRPYANKALLSKPLDKFTKDFAKKVLLEKREVTTECWDWIGSVNSGNGYGRVVFGGKTWAIHRLSYVTFKTPIPIGQCVLHKCDNRVCFNPKHLFLGTHYDNVLDMISKGRNRNPAGKDHHAAVLNEVKVIKIIELWNGGMPANQIAVKIKCPVGPLMHIVRRKTWVQVTKGMKIYRGKPHQRAKEALAAIQKDYEGK